MIPQYSIYVMEQISCTFCKIVSTKPNDTYEGAEVEWDILCPRRDIPSDIPSGMSRTGRPILDVLIRTSRPGHDVPNGTSYPGHDVPNGTSQTGRPI